MVLFFLQNDDSNGHFIIATTIPSNDLPSLSSKLINVFIQSGYFKLIFNI